MHNADEYEIDVEGLSELSVHSNPTTLVSFRFALGAVHVGSPDKSQNATTDKALG
jgi:hypothetical protein